MGTINDGRSSAQPDPPEPQRKSHGPRIHPRVDRVRRAASNVAMATLATQRDHGLTTIETLLILVEAQASVLKYALRAERHPKSPDTPADVM